MNQDQLNKLFEKTTFAEEDETKWDGLEFVIGERPWIQQGSYFGETLISLGDTYENCGHDALFLQELVQLYKAGRIKIETPPRPNTIDVNEVRALQERMREINRLDLKTAVIVEDGIELVIDPIVLEEWRFIGMGNTGFIDTEFYKATVEECHQIFANEAKP